MNARRNPPTWNAPAEWNQARKTCRNCGTPPDANGKCVCAVQQSQVGMGDEVGRKDCPECGQRADEPCFEGCTGRDPHDAQEHGEIQQELKEILCCWYVTQRHIEALSKEMHDCEKWELHTDLRRAYLDQCNRIQSLSAAALEMLEDIGCVVVGDVCFVWQPDHTHPLGGDLVARRCLSLG